MINNLSQFSKEDDENEVPLKKTLQFKKPSSKRMSNPSYRIKT